MGTTLYDLRTLLKERGINIAGTADFGSLNNGQFEGLDELTRNNYVKKLEEFTERCLKAVS